MLPTVPESVLKKRKAVEKNQARLAAAALEAKKQKKAARRVIFKRAEAYVKEYRNNEREAIRMKRIAKSSGNFYVDAQPKLAFVIRIKGYHSLILANCLVSTNSHLNLAKFCSFFASVKLIMVSLSS